MFCRVHTPAALRERIALVPSQHTCDIVRHVRVLTRYEPHVEQVEWQKRGLPHAHILLILDEPIHPDRFDEYGDMSQTSTDSW